MDRLSTLPDELMFRVLSFLPPKILVQTSILAKRWRFCWSRVLCFGFTDQVKVTPQNLNSFFGTSNRDFESWVSAALARNPRILVVGLNYQPTLPPCLFTSETLLYLRIFDGGSITDLGCPRILRCGVCFPVLKKLELDNVGFDSLTHLLKGCPVLEELTIERMNQEACVVISETITTLVIDIEKSGIVSLVTPSLRCLRFCARMSKIHSFSARELAFLVEADIDLMNVSRYHFSHSVTNFVSELYNAKRLTLSTRQLMDVPTSCFYELGGVKFHNLTQLNLCADWRFITCFLENANNLRVLTIHHMVDHGTQHWMEPKEVPACLASNLETVSLIDFGWSTQHEFDMLEYILYNAKVLKRMEIICTHQSVEFEAIKKFAMFEIRSRTCELILTLDAEI